MDFSLDSREQRVGAEVGDIGADPAEGIGQFFGPSPRSKAACSMSMTIHLSWA
jgi:hypothetical protein